MFASSSGGEHNTIYEPVKLCDAVVLAPSSQTAGRVFVDLVSFMT